MPKAPDAPSSPFQNSQQLPPTSLNKGGRTFNQLTPRNGGMPMPNKPSVMTKTQGDDPKTEAIRRLMFMGGGY